MKVNNPLIASGLFAIAAGTMGETDMSTTTGYGVISIDLLAWGIAEYFRKG